MSKNRKGFLVYIILIWCFYLYFCKESVPVFINDWHDLKQNVSVVPHAGSSHRVESHHSPKQHLMMTALMNLGLLAMIIFHTISYFKALKKKDDPQSEKAWLVSKSRRRMLVISIILFWCSYLLLCDLTVRMFIANRHFSQLMAQINAENTPPLPGTEPIDVEPLVSSTVQMAICNLVVLAVGIWSTKIVVNKLKNNNINNNGNPATLS